MLKQEQDQDPCAEGYSKDTQLTYIKLPGSKIHPASLPAG